MPPASIRRLAMLFLALALAGCARPPEGAGPAAAANAFFAAVSRGDIKAAYESAAFGFQASQTLEAFRSNCQDLGLVGAQPPVWTQTVPKAGQTVLSGLVTNQAGKALNLSATLVPDGSTWKLYALHTDKPNGDHQTENRFTLVGKGADFRDVYHQPIPDAPELAALAQETMAKFAEALQRRNFQSFYEYVAQGWRDGTVPSGPEANGDLAMPTPAGNQIQADGRLTVPLLQSNFGPFIEKKVDLTQMAKTPPVFDRPPRIDSNGELSMEGYFTDGVLRANFSFQYIYELPAWRLCGLNVGVTK